MCWSHNPLYVSLLKPVSKACLLATVVSASLIESYKRLSPGSCDEPVNVLAQISQQLVNISNGIPLESIESSQPFKRTTTILMVNILWFDSLVLYLTCSIFAELIQQHVRRYQALAQELDLVQPKGKPKELRKRASSPLRKALFESLKKLEVERIHQLLAIARRYPLLDECSRLYFLHQHDDRIRLPRLSLYILSHKRHFDAFTALFLRLPIWHTFLSTHVVLLPCFLLGDFLESFEVS